ncbi:MAG: ABC transporter permease, partial [Mesorhizobium sp.]
MSAVLEQIFQVGFLAAIIRIATPLAFATLGEMFSERAGVLNLGIEGIMLLAAMAGFTAASLSGSLWLGVLVAVLVGAAMGAVHGLFTVVLGLSQHVCGIGVTLFCSGLAYFLYRLIFGQQSVPPSIKGFQPAPIPLLSDIPILGPAVFNQFTLVYLAIIAVPFAAFVLYRTPWGLSVRMVGENPR